MSAEVRAAMPQALELIENLIARAVEDCADRENAHA